MGLVLISAYKIPWRLGTEFTAVLDKNVILEQIRDENLRCLYPHKLLSQS